ncbi:penicillin-binding transpeptidase domain-containing protein [Actinomadura rupiterrae]|uniref:penicillin-binding transpeptidase domain-containing protein n=1 Tax=Actinomadura rupiterrae TaxID=559627 RepID=UPI0020A3D3EF|nr:penicillin-binding transpeptidase domain-containing protein [Actinomadura rupiterrae]MCP2335249.1 cell division protein FtsI/penicillin-binding protein 2 [Actinomadura rupiterrae]
MNLRGRSRARRTISAGACVVLVGGSASACFAERSAMPAVRDFLVAWEVGNYKAAAGHTTGTDKAQVEAALGGVRGQLDAAALKLGMIKVVKTGKTATAKFSVKIDLGENGEPWTYTSLMHLLQTGGSWKIRWDPSIIHPLLRSGQRLAVVTQVPSRASIQDQNSRSVLKAVPADLVGVIPGELKDPKATIDQMVKTTKIEGGRRLDGERLLGRVQSAPPQAFLPLLTLQRAGGDTLIERLRRVDGLRFKIVNAPIQPQFAPEVVGELGAATADRLQQVGAPYQPGDTIGVSGLQLLMQRRLAGTPTIEVVAQDPAGSSVTTLHSWPGHDPVPVVTTLDRKIQPRADQALADVKYPASLVVVRPGTGDVLAVANHGTRGRDQAMEGHYPPGMAFSFITADALLQNGVPKDTQADCPASANIGGQTVANPSGKAARTSTLERDFSVSCATTLAQLAAKLPPQALSQSAARFGLGKDWGGLFPSFAGQVPTAANDGQKALVATGQGGVTTSPLAMAAAAAAVSSGTWRPPYITKDPVDTPSAQPQILSPVATGDLKRMVRRSVQSGSAKDANVSSGGQVSGVSTVVSYQEGGQTKYVSWFVGFRDDMAFAIAVEGKVNPAKIAATFLTGTTPSPPSSTKPPQGTNPGTNPGTGPRQPSGGGQNQPGHTTQPTTDPTRPANEPTKH